MPNPELSLQSFYFKPECFINAMTLPAAGLGLNGHDTKMSHCLIFASNLLCLILVDMMENVRSADVKEKMESLVESFVGFGETLRQKTMDQDLAVAWELDVLFSMLSILCMLHALIYRGFRGAGLVLIVFIQGCILEQTSIWLGGTHCHATGTVMLTPCSSLNSVLFYVPWSYAALTAAQRLQLSSFGFPFMTGLLQFGFSLPYVLQGPSSGWWTWPDPTGLIAQSPQLVVWKDFPDVGLDRTAYQLGHIDVVRGPEGPTGFWYSAPHVQEALERRWHGCPVVEFFFHLCFGLGFCLALVLTGPTRIDSDLSLGRLLLASVLGVPLALLPFVALSALSTTNNSTDMPQLEPLLLLPLVLALCLVPVLLCGPHPASVSRYGPRSLQRLEDFNSWYALNKVGQHKSAWQQYGETALWTRLRHKYGQTMVSRFAPFPHQRKDYLLFYISFFMHLYQSSHLFRPLHAADRHGQTSMLCYAKLCYATLCYAMLCYATLSYAMLCYATLCYALPYYAMLCYAYAMLCHAMLCYAMLCYAMLCYATLRYATLCYAKLC
eukprot:g64079.t1